MNGASSSTTNPSGVQGLCPDGWHLPSNAEWKELELFIGMDPTIIDNAGWRGNNNEGGKLKTTTLWDSPNAGATNSTNFSGVPGGSRSFSAIEFVNIGILGTWWASTGGTQSHARRLSSDETGVFLSTNMGNDNGFSIRCVKD